MLPTIITLGCVTLNVIILSKYIFDKKSYFYYTIFEKNEYTQKFTKTKTVYINQKKILCEHLGENYFTIRFKTIDLDKERLFTTKGKFVVNKNMKGLYVVHVVSVKKDLPFDNTINVNDRLINSNEGYFFDFSVDRNINLKTIGVSNYVLIFTKIDEFFIKQ